MMRKIFFVCVVLTALSFVWSQPPWHQLYLDGGGYWKGRIRLEVENLTSQDVKGGTIRIKVGPNPGELNLVGEEAKALRVCDEEGRELLFDILSSAGRSKRSGELTKGDVLLLPVEVKAGERKGYFVYYGNKDAWGVPDFWKGELYNGGFEIGKDSPEDWSAVETDAYHQVFWVRENPHSGRYCVKTVVREGASPSWVKHQQTNIPIVEGRRYILRAWVKARDVKGTAGWFIHVFGAKGWLINQVLNAGGGTYDWKEITYEFVAPESATHATIGTVLYGTGTAWFDDVSLQPTEPMENLLRIAVGGREEMRLREIKSGSKEKGASFFQEIKVRNFSNSPKEGVLISLELNRLRRYIPSLKFRILDPETKKTCPYIKFEDILLFIASLPAKSEKVFLLYPDEKGEEMDLQQLITSKVNLVKNPSFEEEDENHLPAYWQSGFEMEKREGKAVIVSSLREENVVLGIPSLDSRDPALGNKCARLEIPEGAPLRWAGWRQEIPAKPNTTYLYLGFLKTENLKGDVALYGHFHDKEGKLCQGAQYFQTAPALSGTRPWTLTYSLLQTPYDCASVELHLTVNAHGIVYHDGIFFAEVEKGIWGQACAPPSKEMLNVWQIDPLIKVFQDDVPGLTPKEIRLYCAINERESLQLALRSEKGLKGIRISVRKPMNKAGQTLPDIKVNLVGYVPIDVPSAYYSSPAQAPWYRLVPKGTPRSDGWAGYWPDPLLPYKPFDLPPQTTQPIWLTVQVPPNASPGEYKSLITIQGGNAQISIPLTIKVWSFSLPKSPSLKVIFDFHSNAGLDLKSWYRFYAEHRISPNTIRPEPTIDYKDGQVSLNTSGFDEMAHYCLDKLGMSVVYLPGFFYMMGWGFSPKQMFGYEAFTPEFNLAFSQCYRAFLNHLKEKGWKDKFVYYVADEPHYWFPKVVENMRKMCDLIHSVSRDIPIYSSVWDYVGDWVGYLDIWGVGPHGSCPVDKMEELKRSGAKLWFTTDGHMCIDTPYLAIERLLPYLCWKYGVEGYEFWGLNWWTYNPYEKGWHVFLPHTFTEGGETTMIRYPNGDGFLSYPPVDKNYKEPVSTIRLEQVREGIEDYEYLVLLDRLVAEARGKGMDVSQASRILERARALVSIPNKGGLRSLSLLPRPSKVAEIRRAMGEEIERLLRERKE